MIPLLLIPVLAVLNRFRGGGFGADKLPGHPRYYAAPIIGLLIAGLYGWLDGLLVAVSYLIWSLFPWGHLIGLGRWDPPRPWSKFELRCLSAARGNIYVALALLEIVAMGVAAALIHPSALVVGIGFVCCYEIGWRLRPKAPIELAELLIGAVWAAFLLAALSGCAPQRSYDWGGLANGVGRIENGR